MEALQMQTLGEVSLDFSFCYLFREGFCQYTPKAVFNYHRLFYGQKKLTLIKVGSIILEYPIKFLILSCYLFSKPLTR